jgi:hypothetical protein
MTIAYIAYVLTSMIADKAYTSRREVESTLSRETALEHMQYYSQAYWISSCIFVAALGTNSYILRPPYVRAACALTGVNNLCGCSQTTYTSRHNQHPWSYHWQHTWHAH